MLPWLFMNKKWQMPWKTSCLVKINESNETSMCVVEPLESRNYLLIAHGYI